MIVLITGSPRARECAVAIERETHLKTAVATSAQQALELLRNNEYELLVLDESFQQVDPARGHQILAAAGLATPVYINLALHGSERVAREVQCGLRRRTQERVRSLRAAESLLHNELRSDLTAVLLNCELAMQEKSLPQTLAGRLHTMHDLAEKMRSRLEERAQRKSRV